MCPASLPESEFDFDAWVRQVRPQLLACVQQSQDSSRQLGRPGQAELRRQGRLVQHSSSED